MAAGHHQTEPQMTRYRIRSSATLDLIQQSSALLGGTVDISLRVHHKLCIKRETSTEIGLKTCAPVMPDDVLLHRNRNWHIRDRKIER